MSESIIFTNLPQRHQDVLIQMLLSLSREDRREATDQYLQLKNIDVDIKIFGKEVVFSEFATRMLKVYDVIVALPQELLV